MSTKKKTGAKAPKSKTAGAVPAAALPPVLVVVFPHRANFYIGDGSEPFSSIVNGPPGSDGAAQVEAEIARLRAEGRTVTVK